jgi:hypothetical protein
MNIQARLDKIARLTETGEEFAVKGRLFKQRFRNQTLEEYDSLEQLWFRSQTSAVDLLFSDINPHVLPQLTADEKNFLSYYPQDWWIARDEIGDAIFMYDKKPYKKYTKAWGLDGGYEERLSYCPPLLGIKWKDDDCYTIGELCK